MSAPELGVFCFVGLDGTGSVEGVVKTKMWETRRLW